jgi:hypothetical protein
VVALRVPVQCTVTPKFAAALAEAIVDLDDNIASLFQGKLYQAFHLSSVFCGAFRPLPALVHRSPLAAVLSAFAVNHVVLPRSPQELFRTKFVEIG